jgi:hypothetical protein
MQNRPHAEEDQAPTADGTGTPDQDGPHDVPDSQVIEKTLPAKTGGEGDKPSN